MWRDFVVYTFADKKLIGIFRHYQFIAKMPQNYLVFLVTF